MSQIDINKQKKKDSLLDNAFELFTTKGFSKTSIADIVNSSGIAKGTFYLYFKDKYDIRNKLIAHKSSQLFRKVCEDMEKKQLTFSCLSDKIVYVLDETINQLVENPSLLSFISKNLSWGIFKTALTTPIFEDDVDFSAVYQKILADAERPVKDPELMLFMIIELTSSTCYSAILYQEPVSVEQLKPELYETVREIIKRHMI